MLNKQQFWLLMNDQKGLDTRDRTKQTIGR